LFIISSFDHPKIPGTLSRIPANKILVISRNDRLENKYNSIFQDFNQGTFEALSSALSRIKHYKEFVLSFPLKSGHSQTLKNGFERFWIEKIRVNDEIPFLGMHPSQAEIISTLLFFTGIIGCMVLYRRHQASTTS
jgi:hypothetical protein